MPVSEPNRPVSSATIDPQLLVDPIGFLQTEIYRQRVACNTLEALALAGANGDARTDAGRVLRYVVEDLQTHNGDLEDCLFPLLRQKSLPDDNLEHLVAHYRSLRERRDERAGKLVSILECMAHGDPPPADLPAVIRAFVVPWRSDVAAENDDILPLAERRLTDADLKSLGQAMALRRGNTHSK